MDQEPIVGRKPLLKRLWFRISGSLLLLLIAAGGVYWWLQSGRITATALFRVAHSVPSFSSPNGEHDLGEYEYGDLKRTQIALLQSDFVLTAALRNPGIGALSIVQGHADPVQWLQKNLVINYPEDGALLSISLTGDESAKEDLVNLVNAIATSYRNEVVDRGRQERLVFRDMLSRTIDNLNIEIKRKLDEYLDITRESGRVEGSSGGVLHSLAQKRIDRIEDELMRLENQLAIDAKDSKSKSSQIEKRLAELRKSRDEESARLSKEVERSADLETRKSDLEQLQSLVAEMSKRLECIDLDANAPDRIQQVQAAVISPQSMASRFPANRGRVANSR